MPDTCRFGLKPSHSRTRILRRLVCTSIAGTTAVAAVISGYLLGWWLDHVARILLFLAKLVLLLILRRTLKNCRRSEHELSAFLLGFIGSVHRVQRVSAHSPNRKSHWIVIPSLFNGGNRITLLFFTHFELKCGTPQQVGRIASFITYSWSFFISTILRSTAGRHLTRCWRNWYPSFLLEIIWFPAKINWYLLIWLYRRVHDIRIVVEGGGALTVVNENLLELIEWK